VTPAELRALYRWAIDFRRRMLVADEDRGRGHCAECGRVLGAEPEYTQGCKTCANRHYGHRRRERGGYRVTA